MAKITPNSEQQAIIDAAKTGGNGVIQALAGTGKTSTLRMLAEALSDRRILYVAFNRSVADEAERTFPHNVTSRNPHRLAYRPYARQVQRRGSKYPSARFLASALHIQPFSGSGEHGDLKATAIAVAVKEAVGKFCMSADREPNEWHVRRTDIVRNADDANRDRLVAHILPYVKRAWTDIADPNGTLPYMPGRGDSCYLKLWSLSDPQLGFDVILLDEAQDTNPAVAHVVGLQKGQKIMVGDSNQAIYGWNGAVDAMKNFQADWTLSLTQSYRFGQAVADRANRWLRHTESTLEVVGFDKLDSKVEFIEQPSAILCRTNAGCIESAMGYMDKGLKVAIAGGTKDIEAFAKAANDLMQGRETNHPELAAFNTWQDVVEAVRSGDSPELGMMVRLLDKYGTHAVLEVCRNSAKPEDADIFVSTAHKAKGLEWDHVQIHGDFQAPKEGKKLSVTEAMLIYVAVTRAKLTLDDEALAWLERVEQDMAEAVEDEGEEA